MKDTPYTRMLKRAEAAIDKDDLKVALLYMLAALTLLAPNYEDQSE